MTTYQCDDGFGDPVEIEADSPQAAAQKYVDEESCYDTDTDEDPSTTWVHVRVWEEDEDGAEIVDHGDHSVSLDPEEPECTHEGGHDWQAPHTLVGSICENPGVWGHGGGVVAHEVCVRCGAGMETDTWAQDRCTGEQGLRSITYQPPGTYDLTLLNDDE